MTEYHRPVMLDQCVEALNIKPGGEYVDVTFGGGGHSREILKNMDGGMLYSFDQDKDAAEVAKDIQDRSFTFIGSNFRYLRKYLKFYGVKQVDGILADLGVSSHQLNTSTRGFSFRFDADLDMRMDNGQNTSAYEVVNEYSQDQLHKIFGIYGEVKNARTLASTILSERAFRPIKTTKQLAEAIAGITPRNRENKYLAQVFQALRIEVNDEIKVLEDFLEQIPEVLKPGGRLVVMSYHSLEDRLVKNYISKGKFMGEVEKDLYGNMIKPLDSVTRKPIVASEQETMENPRARSAKLRIAERNAIEWRKTD